MEVALVNMPFAPLNGPPAGLSLLKAVLRERGIEARIYHPHLWIAKWYDQDFINDLVSGRYLPNMLVREFLFADAVFGRDPEADDRYLAMLSRWIERQTASGADHFPPDWFDRYNTLRGKIGEFLDRCIESVDWSAYKVVGFTTVFEQTLASLALAKRLKERYPHLFIVMGGPNCESIMGVEILRQFRWLDAVCSGEGEQAFPLLLERYLSGKPIGDIPGIIHRGDGEPEVYPEKLHTEPTYHLDKLPYPDYDDFARDYIESGLSFDTYLLFETSRGCWWGAKQHCVFCGLNGSTLDFRSKSPKRALEEIAHLAKRYEHLHPDFAAADNILDYRYFTTLLPELKKLGINFFYEVKSNLTEAQVQSLADSGMTFIQPGIESLSTNILQLMRKGVSALQNIQMLKWCKQYGIRPSWNMLVGFVGESADDYAEMMAKLPLLYHLEPPTAARRVRITRFSPYHSAYEQFGIRNLRPAPAYPLVFRGLSAEAVSNLAYYFEGDFEISSEFESYFTQLGQTIVDWQRHAPATRLCHFEVDDRLYIRDTRPCAKQPSFVLKGLMKAVYSSAHTITTQQRITKAVSDGAGQEVSRDQVESCLNRLLAMNLLICENGQYLTLSTSVEARANPEKLRNAKDLVRGELARMPGSNPE